VSVDGREQLLRVVHVAPPCDSGERSWACDLCDSVTQK